MMSGGKNEQVMLGDISVIIVSAFITLLERLSFAGEEKDTIDLLPTTSSLVSHGVLPSRGWKCLRGRC